MKMLVPAAGLALLTVSAVADPGGQRRGDQATASEGRKARRLQPLDQIIRRVSAQLPGWDYSGFEFDADSSGRAVSKLVSVRDGNVTWIYVDGRTGNTLGRR